MDLFNSETTVNILPGDGITLYHGIIITPTEARHYLETLLEKIEWKNDEAIIFGRHIMTKRKAAWYGDQCYAYTYSNITKQALPWIKELQELKKIAEQISGSSFNSCLLNLYHDGDEGMAWHSDDEKELAAGSAIASLSLGAPRKFSFKHKQTKETISLVLEEGSLLVMKDGTQKNWLHSLPKSKKITLPRINLTFRTMNAAIPRA